MEEQISKLDLLQIVKNGGMAKGFAFYSFGFFGTLSMTISMILLMTNALNSDNIKILKSISNNNQMEFSQFQDQMLLTINNNLYKFQLLQKLETISNYEFENQLYELQILVGQKKMKTQNVAKFQFSNFKHTLYQHTCGDHCITVNYFQQDKLNEEQTYLEAICFVLSENNILDGCYKNGEFAKYGIKKVDIVPVTIRNNKDPIVLLQKETIKIPQNYDPLFIIGFGCICYFACVIILMLVKKNKQQEEIELQEIRRPQITRLVPLNY